MPSLADPRTFPLSGETPSGTVASWLGLVEQGAAATAIATRASLDAELERSIAGALAAANVALVREGLASARSASGYRHLWRATIAAWRSLAATSGPSVVAHAFAIPMVIVAAAEQDVELPLAIPAPQAIVEAMREHGALAGNRNFGIGSVLVGETDVGLDAAVRWPSPSDFAGTAAFIDAEVASPVRVVAGRESAHLRWLPGSAVAAPGSDLFVEKSSGRWGLKTAEILSRDLGRGVAQVLALPGAPSDLIGTWQQGVVAHREVALQLFASSALRTLRAAYGEPAAVVSAHRSGQGELRISLSSPLGERNAEGFRFPLFPFERIDDALKTITDLLEACRLPEVTVLPGVHPERDPLTGLPLFFRGDALPDAGRAQS